MTTLTQTLLRELCDRLLHEGMEIKGAKGIEGYESPVSIANDGFGSGTPPHPDLLGYDPAGRRVIFGLVRESRETLDSEKALEEYNVFLDHNASLGEQASVLYVIMPGELVNDFTEIITHYIHRNYWNRIIAVPAHLPPPAGGANSDL
jgi:hypothetical protein